MPAQDRRWGDEKRRPPLPREQTTQEGQQRPVGWREPRSPRLAAEDGELVAQHQDLDVFDCV